MDSLASKCLLFVVLAGVALSVRANGMQVRIAGMKSAAGSMQGIVVDLYWPRGMDQGRLRVRAARIALPSLAYEARDVDWQCPLIRVDGGWACSGTVRVRGNAPGRLSMALAPAATRVELQLGNRRLALENQAGSPDRNRISLERIPVDWLKAFLAGLWPEGRWTTGSLSGRVDIASPAKGPFRVDTDLQLSDVGVETPAGDIAAASLAGRLAVGYRAEGGDTWIDARFTAS